MSKFVYFGTPAVARATLEALLTAGYTPTLVVTSPDAPRGRGLLLTPSPTKTLAIEHGIPVITPEQLDPAAMAAIAAHGADYAVCVAYGKIFPEALIASFPKGVLNIHYSLLPKYRGATPLETALLAGETETGVTIQKMVKEMDAGDILAQEATLIGERETARELRPRLVEMGARLLVETLPAFERGEVELVVQDASRATRAYKIKKEDGELDLAAPGEENWNKYRAYADSIGTYFFEGEKRMKITNAEFASGKFRILRVIPEGKSERPY
jgi:methionyl-tRNA formyltransferase